MRVYNTETKSVTSYPRALIEKEMGIKLKPYEHVHHKDGNPLNNDLSNLEILPSHLHAKIHSQKYFDKEMICPYCNKVFIWTALSQKYFYSNASRIVCRHKNAIGKPFCSKSCAGSYSRQEQLRRDSQAECGLNGEVVPNDNAVPIHD
jgi:hypothetical protein